MPTQQPAFQRKRDIPTAMLDRLLRVLAVACVLVIAWWAIWHAASAKRAKQPPAPPCAAENGDDPIAAAVRALDALTTLERHPDAEAAPQAAAPAPPLSRAEAKKSAESVRRVAADAKEEIRDLGLAETEEAGLVARDWLTAETAFSMGSWEAAEKSYYLIINRVRQLREVVRISRELDASERAVAAALAAERKLLKQYGGERLREVVAIASQARSLVKTDPILSAKLYQEALTKLPLAIGEARRAERHEKIEALLQLARHAAERGDWVAASTAANAILKVEPGNAGAAALRGQAMAGIDALVGRYVTRQHEPDSEAARKADAAQLRRGVRDAEPLCLVTAALYSPGDPCLGVETGEREQKRAAGWPETLRRAEAQWPGASFIVGRCYEEGFGVERDMPAAMQWYRQAAERDHTAAQNNLARLYHHGVDGVAQDNTEAARWYRQAALKGSIPAQCALAGILLSSTNEAAAAEAVAWYRKAATAGSPLAQCNLGLLLMTGRGTTRDELAASVYFQKAADKGDALAQFNLGYLFMTGKGVGRDDALAVAWYRKAAEQGFAAAQRNLGGMYALGRGVRCDEETAAAWYTRAATQGDAGAQCNIGWMLARGEGVPKDEAKAVKWLALSANQRNPEAMFLLGMMTLEGKGTARDEARGQRLIAEAAAHGFEPATRWLDLQQRRAASPSDEAD